MPFQKVLNHTSRFAISLQFECNLRQAVSRTVLSKITRKVLLHQSWSGGKHLTPLEASPYLHSFPDDYKPHSLCAYIHQNQPPAVLLLLFTHAQFFVTSWAVARQAPLSTGFPRQEYWSGLPIHSPGDLPDRRTEPMSPALQMDSLPPSHLGSPCQSSVLFLFRCL